MVSPGASWSIEEITYRKLTVINMVGEGLGNTGDACRAVHVALFQMGDCNICSAEHNESKD